MTEDIPTAEMLQEAFEYWSAGLGGSDGGEVQRFLAEHDAQLIENIANILHERSGGRPELWLREQVHAAEWPESVSSAVGVLIGMIDKHRPLGPNGKHGNLHTSTCGCDDREGDEQ